MQYIQAFMSALNHFGMAYKLFWDEALKAGGADTRGNAFVIEADDEGNRHVIKDVDEDVKFCNGELSAIWQKQRSNPNHHSESNEQALVLMTAIRPFLEGYYQASDTMRKHGYPQLAMYTQAMGNQIEIFKASIDGLSNEMVTGLSRLAGGSGSTSISGAATANPPVAGSSGMGVSPAKRRRTDGVQGTQPTNIMTSPGMASAGQATMQPTDPQGARIHVESFLKALADIDKLNEKLRPQREAELKLIFEGFQSSRQSIEKKRTKLKSKLDSRAKGRQENTLDLPDREKVLKWMGGITHAYRPILQNVFRSFGCSRWGGKGTRAKDSDNPLVRSLDDAINELQSHFGSIRASLAVQKAYRGKT